MPFPSQRHDVVVTHSASTSSSGSINTGTASSRNSSNDKLSYRKKSRSNRRRNRRQRTKSPNSNHKYNDRASSRSRDCMDTNDDHVDSNNNTDEDHHNDHLLQPQQLEKQSNLKSPETTEAKIVTRKYSLFRKITCYIIILLVGFMFVITNNWNYIRLNPIHNTHTTKLKTKKSGNNAKGALNDDDEDSLIVYPLQPHVQSILGVDHYYMTPYDILPGGGHDLDNDDDENDNENEKDTKLEQEQTRPPSPQKKATASTSWFSNLKHRYYTKMSSTTASTTTESNDDDGIQLDTKSAVQQPKPHKMTKKHKYPKPKGILIFLHSCKRSGLDFFYLPEERRIAYNALSNGLAVLSLTSQHRDSGCWTQPDVGWIDNVVDTFIDKHFGDDTENDEQQQVVAVNFQDRDESKHTGLSSSSNSTMESSTTKSGGGGSDGIPRIGIAVSSAASFLFFVYKSLQLQSMAIINSPQSYDIKEIESKLAIPTVYISMPHDKHLAKQMQTNHEALVKANIPSQLYKVRPTPFTYDLCTKRIPELGATLCNQVLTTIQNDYPSLLDSDGFIQSNKNNNNIGGGGDTIVKPSSFVDENNVWYQILQSIGLDDYKISDNENRKHGNNHRLLRKRTKTKRTKMKSTTLTKGDINRGGGGDDDNNKNSSIVYEQQHQQGYYHLSRTSHNGHSWLWAAVEEEISTCYAYHSMTAEHHSSVLDFLIQQAGIE